MEWNLLLVLTILLLLFVIGLAALMRQRRSHRLARRFGPEYDRVVQRMGRAPAEAELAAREERAAALDVQPLAPHEARRMRLEWQALQARFAQVPRSAVAEADLLARDAMVRRGLPMADLEARAAELAVRHPRLLANYRAAHDIALRDRREQVDADSLRLALTHYQALFDELLPAAETPRREAPRHPEPRRGTGLLQPERAMARDRPARDRKPS